MSKKLQGIVPILAAPFTSSGELDEDSFQQLVRHLVGTGVQGLTLFGLATEFYKLSAAERDRLQALLLAETVGRADVAGVVSITDHSWEVALGSARAAEAAGADALMLLPPFFLGPGEPAIAEHVRRVVSGVALPVIVQYAPAQTGVRIMPETFARLGDELPNLRCVKVESQPPGPYVARLVERSAGRIGALVGYAGVQMPDVLRRGAAGIQPGCSFAEVYVELWRLWQAHRATIGTAREDVSPGTRAGNRRPWTRIAAFEALHGRLLPFISYWMQTLELIIAAEKLILERRGIIASAYCRSPSYTLDDIERQMVERFLEEFGFAN